MSENTGSVLVVGGGIGGVQTALDLAESGFKVYLAERKPSIGGVMAQLDKTFPTNDCSMCILSPKLVEAARHPMITMMTLTEVVGVEGEAPNFTVTLKKHPRYVREDRCVGCGLCAEKCPSKAPSEYEVGMVQRKAIFVPYAQAVPMKYSIDASKCLWLTKQRCGNCKKVCPADAVDYEQKEVIEKINVGSIVLAPGFDAFDPRVKREYGYGDFKNVVTSLEFERILSATGPYAGHVVRPTDHKTPKKVAFIQCVGSRDEKVGNPYCSSVCCMYAMKQAIIAKEHTAGFEPHIFFMDIRAFGKEFEDYRARAEKEYGIKMYRGTRVASIDEDPETKNLFLRYSVGDDVSEQEFDMVVLSVGLEPTKSAKELADRLGIKLNPYGFCNTTIYNPLETNRPGIYVTGAFSSPKDIPTTVAEASGAAAKAGRHVFDNRISIDQVVKETPETDVRGQEPRIGVFVCDCGINIRATVDVPSVVEYVKTLPNVVYAEENKYTCSADSQELIKKKIKEHNLNRVVVASCTPRTHEALFQSTIKEAGLNQFLFEMANIRDQCSWIHMHEPEKATAKAKDLVRMAVAKSRFLEPLTKSKLGVTHSAVVVGGGLAGMTAALDIAAQNFHVDLIERSDKLGGKLANLYTAEGGMSPHKYMGELIEKVKANDNIKIYMNSHVEDVSGFVGNYKVKVKTPEGQKELDTGAIIIATGGQEYVPKEYMYGQDKRVLTQNELEDKLYHGHFKGKKVAMIQCVGSRNKEVPYCSRVCCSKALKNAIEIKKKHPETEVYIFHKDIRSYGFRELLYKEAGELGVKFIRFPEDKDPVLSKDGDVLKLVAHDQVLGGEVMVKPDLVVLSTGTRPNPDNEELAKMVKVPLSKDGYFLEAHMKLRPVDFATNGVYLAGIAHWPKFIDETIAQASGAAARAITVISKEFLETQGIIAAVNDMICDGCGVCEPVCEYRAITIVGSDPRDPAKLKAVINEGLCMGCGTCVAACPSGALEQKGFKTAQILAQIDSALEGGAK
ncbi:MAG: CoB--CoM heterodisulfide reductase iron-sulfur subunit A family protein [Methanomassiliicoccales archaeon]|nr:MAG: CoB--CoM heterodisulfide reductase iron-sulfur subunit A family protein [Methanomassiliicoccales archaeon]